ncbi:hypothetical protein ABID16_000081 [Rhizobium aquaticum]|uniref:Uncharacterized protein n=1 Tax=Rhizobium aquaticum TaxID=1549636 RepID=A0ABV2ITP7_9HYPH
MPKEKFWAGGLSDVRIEAVTRPERLFLVIEQKTDEQPACWFDLTVDQARALQRQIGIHLSALEPEFE